MVFSQGHWWICHDDNRERLENTGAPVDMPCTTARRCSSCRAQFPGPSSNPFVYQVHAQLFRVAFVPMGPATVILGRVAARGFFGQVLAT